MMKVRFLVLALLIFLVSGVVPLSASTANVPLPASDWYAVLWDRQNDTLYWVNADGQQASLPRPRLPNEAADSNPQIRISPNGIYLVLAAKLSNNLEGLGIYNLQTASFVNTHQAQAGETIHLGYKLVFNETSERVAVGFMSGTYENPAWRVIAFNTATGDPAFSLNSTDPNPTVPHVQLSMPMVVYYDLESGQETIHFHLIPYGTDGSDQWPAYAWNPATGSVAGSPFVYSGADIMPLTSEMTVAIYDPNYTQLPPNGPFHSMNAIARGFPGSPLTNVWVDGTNYHFSPVWAKGGEYILYYSANSDDLVGNWNAAEANAQPGSSMGFDPSITDVAGTWDGYIFINNQNQVFYTNGFTPVTAPMIFAAPAPVEIVYVTPIGLNFALTTLGEPTTTAAPPLPAPPNPVVSSANCPGAPATRVSVNAQARVTFTDGTPLRLRDNPNGNIITQLPEGTQFTIIGGPQCANSMVWWQIQQSGTTQTGWVAEGNTGGYFIELLPTVAGTGTGSSTSSGTGTGSATGTGTGPSGGGVPGSPITGNGDCSLAPVRRVGIGISVTTANNGGTFAMRTDVTSATPDHQIPGGLTAMIVGGPQCHNGYRWWEVTVTLNGQIVRGWISEGTTSEYFINPQ